MAKITVKLFTILASCVIIGCTTNTNSSSKECEEIIQKENSEKIDTATNDCAKLGMSRNVQSIKVFIYEAKENFDKFEKGELKEKGHYYIVFDKNGCLSESSSFYSTGEHFSKKRYEYKDNKLYKEMFYFDGKLSSTTTYEYDGKHLRSKLEVDNDDDNNTMRFEHINNGEYITEFVRYENDVKKAIFKCKVIGNQTEITAYNINGKPSGHHRIEEHDECGRQTKLIWEGNPCEAKYNEKGLPIYLKNAYISNGIVYFSPFRKDDIRTFEYEYDEKGNWIKRVEYEGEKIRPISISEQTIVY